MKKPLMTLCLLGAFTINSPADRLNASQDSADRDQAQQNRKFFTPEKRAQLLEKFDTNGDGKLNETERAEARKELHAKRPLKKGKLGGHPPMGRRGIKGSQGPAHPKTRLTPEMHEKLLQRFDSDKDGTLSTSEKEAAKAAMKKHLGQVHEKVKGRLLEKFDTDGDGTLNQDERAKAHAAGKDMKGRFHQMQLERFDSDGDGTLSTTERENARQAFQERMEAHRTKADTDGDGQLSREERRAHFESMKAAADTDGDGQLNRDEIKAAIEKGEFIPPPHRRPLQKSRGHRSTQSPSQ